MKGVVRFLFAFADEWRARGLGKKITRRLFPKLAARRAQKAARRAQRQRQPDEAEGEFFLDEGGSMNNVIVTQIVLAVLRHVMTALAPLGVVVSDDWMLQTAAIIVGLVGLVWSFVRKLRRKNEDQ